LIRVPMSGTTIPYQVTVKFGAAKVMLKPAAPGTGIIAGSSIRPVLEASGIKDILTKSLGSANRINIAKATILALSKLKNPREVVAKRKGIVLEVPEEETPLAEVTAEGEETEE
jgi:small subunit ribosomal protein S5